MRFWHKWPFFRKKKNVEEEQVQAEKKSFYLYIVRVPEIVTYLRREKGIPRRKLELTLVDNGEQPSWKILQIVELLIPDLNLLYVITERPEAFEEAAGKALAERGLLVVFLPADRAEDPPGNLVLDLNDWEKHLDIIPAVRYYNTLIR